MPSTVAIVWVTKSGAESGARSTHQTPSGKSFTRLDASRIARRVFPTPPAPVKVSSRVDLMASESVTSSA